MSVRKPGWGVATVIVLVVFGLVLAPFLLALGAPDRAEGTVGKLEQVTLQTEDGGTSARGGFIAPEGWMHENGEEDEAERSFVYAGSGTGVRLTVSVHANVSDSEALLREEVPAGAALAPVQRIDESAWGETLLLEHDLSAGSGVSQRIVTCMTLRTQACLLFEVEMEGASSGQGDPLLPEVRAVVASAEVVG